MVATSSAERLEARRSSRRAEILRAAGHELLVAGYSGAALDDVAAAVHVSKATLYHYFPTKQALYLAWVKMVHRSAIARIEPAHEDPALDPAQRLAAMVKAQVVVFASDFPDYARVFLRGMDWPPELGEVIRGHRIQLERLFGEVIADGIERGQFTVSDPTVARFCLQGCLAYIPEWFHADGPLSAQQLGDEIAVMSLRLLGAEAPESAIAESPA
ncbi:MAG: TetR family transcriptional regulator [Solirubrobacterales bacterium]